MTRHATFCRICEASCGLLAEVEGGQVTALAPDPDHVVSRGYACTKGVRYLDVHASPDRLRTPLKRVGSRFEPVTWAQALSEIGGKLRALRAEHGHDSAGVYIGNPTAFSLPHAVFAGAFLRALGSRHLYTSASQDCSNKFVAAEEMFGSALLQAIPDVDHSQCVILVGTNPAVSQLSFVNMPRAIARLKACVRRGGRVVFVNPRRTESAEQVGEQLFIRPGADVFFFLAFAHVVCAEVEPRLAHTRGFEELCAAVRAFPPERVAEHTGIAADVVRELARVYLTADGAVLYAGTGVNQGPHGTLCQWLIWACAVVSGQFDRRGGLIMTRQQQRTARHGAPHGDAIPHSHARVGGFRSVLDCLPAGVLPDEILREGPGQLHALFVTAGNPLLSCPNGARMEEALSKLSLLVSIDLFRNETGNLAHYVLPTSSFLERPDLPLGVAGYQPVPYLQYAPALVARPEGVEDEWWIFTQLAHAAGIALSGSRAFQRYAYASAAGRLPRTLRFSPALLFGVMALAERVSWRALLGAPHGLLLPVHRHGAFLRKGVLTGDGKVALAPARFVAALEGVERALAEARAHHGLRLITKRERHSHNSWMHNVPADARRATNHVYMHPDDAAARGLRDGETCEVRSATGSVRVPLALSDALMPGSVALPHGWGHAQASGLRLAQASPGVNANLLAPDGPDALEALSGMARLTAIDVEVSRDS